MQYISAPVLRCTNIMWMFIPLASIHCLYMSWDPKNFSTSVHPIMTSPLRWIPFIYHNKKHHWLIFACPHFIQVCECRNFCSQPPLLSSMVFDIYKRTGELALVKKALPALLKEHHFWNSGVFYLLLMFLNCTYICFCFCVSPHWLLC